jgi:predicted ferric reductase
MATSATANKAGKTITQRLLRGAFSVASAVFMACILAVPFVYESQTLWYKTGVDRLLLQGGQLLGLLALFSLIAQIILGTRGKILEEAFGVARLVRWHKSNGLLLCFLAFLHVLLIVVPEGVANLPLGKKYWPEMVGGLLLVLLFLQAVFSLLRQKLDLNYLRWRVVHRGVGYLALGLVALHVLFVADSFAQGVPRGALVLVLAALMLVISAVKFSKKYKNRG